MADREQKIWDGYGMPSIRGGDISSFKAELEVWIEQISSEEDDPNDLEEALYWELGDWFDDEIATEAYIYEDQQDFFSIRMKVTLNADGTYIIEEPSDKPSWQTT